MAAELTCKDGGGRGELMKIKMAVGNLLILVPPGGTTTIYTRAKFLKIRVFRLAKIGFLTHFFM